MKKSKSVSIFFVVACIMIISVFQLKTSVENFFAQRVACGATLRFNAHGDAQRAYDALGEYFGKDDVARVKEIKRLAGGNSTALVFSLIFKDKRYVVRLLSSDLSIQMFQSEREAHMLAYKAGVAPALYYIDESRCVLIMEFIEGEVLHNMHFESYDTYKWLVIQCAKALREVHKINSDVINFFSPLALTWYEKSLALSDIARECKQWLEPVKETAPVKRLEKKLPELVDVISKSLMHTKTLTHNDLHGGNIMLDPKKQKVVLIDWSHARIDSPFNDVMRFITLFQPAYEYRNDFYVEYFKRSLDFYDRALIRLMEHFFQIWLIAGTINSNIVVQNIMSNKRQWKIVRPTHPMHWYKKEFFIKPSLARAPTIICQQIKAGLQEVLWYLASDQYVVDKQVLLSRVSIENKLPRFVNHFYEIGLGILQEKVPTEAAKSCIPSA